MSHGIHSWFKRDNLVIVGQTYPTTRLNAISLHIVSLQQTVIETVEQYTRFLCS